MQLFQMEQIFSFFIENGDNYIVLLKSDSGTSLDALSIYFKQKSTYINRKNSFQPMDSCPLMRATAPHLLKDLNTVKPQ